MLPGVRRARARTRPVAARAPQRSARSSSCSAAFRRPKGSCGEWPCISRIESRPVTASLAASLSPVKQVVLRGGKTQVVDVARARPDGRGAVSSPTPRRRSPAAPSAPSSRRGSGSLAARAISNPDLVRADAQARTRARRARDGRRSSAARSRPDSPLGYSSAGTVLDTGGSRTSTSASGSPAPAPGARTTQRSCPSRGTSSCAVPEGVARCATRRSRAIGAIALQGVRRAEPALGDRVVVVGLGLLGLITVQMLRAAGCRVVGVEPVERRRALAARARRRARARPCRGGRGRSRRPGSERRRRRRRRRSRPRRSGDELVNDAVRMLRRKGRVVPVGDVGLGFDREALYEREADVLISTSYGPGPLRPVVRGGRPRLPAAVRALDGGPQHGGVPAAARRRATSRSSRSSSSSCRSTAPARRTRRSPATIRRWPPCSPTRNARPIPQPCRDAAPRHAARPRTARSASRSSARAASSAPMHVPNLQREDDGARIDDGRQPRRSSAASLARSLDGATPRHRLARSGRGSGRRSRRSSARATTRTPRSRPPRCAPARRCSSRSRSA